MNARPLPHVLLDRRPARVRKDVDRALAGEPQRPAHLPRDALTYEHHYRSLERGLPHAALWDSMTPDERFGPRGGPSNETHLRQILLWLAATPAAGDPSSYVYAFGYECGRSGCEERVPTIVRAYERLVGRGGALLSHPNHGALSTH